MDDDLDRETALLQGPFSAAPDALPFWEAARRHELRLPYCRSCAAFFFYPRPMCPRCGSREIDWRAVTGRGSLYTFCIQYRASVPGLEGAVPFVTALVRLDEGPRLMSFLVGVSPEPGAIACDMRVHVDFLDRGDGWSLPVFRPDTLAGPAPAHPARADRSA